MSEESAERKKAVALYQAIKGKMEELIQELETPLEATFKGKKQGVVVCSLLLIAAAIMSDPLNPIPESLDPTVLEMFRMFLENRHNSIPTFVGFHPRSTPNS